MKKIAIVPIDNRPVTYLLPQQICAIDKNIELYCPKRELLGDIKRQANIEEILKWLENLENIDILIVSLDTIAYGGLVPSRFCSDNKETIQKRINKLKSIIREKKIKTFALSSIMRISNNNCNDEEKPYWAQFGKRIFEYSYACHKTEKTLLKEDDQLCICSKSRIPDEILTDYINTRNRNFEINKEYIEWIKDKTLDTLVFSKDDCAKYGWNVKEAEELENLAKDYNNIFVKTGADEIPLSLLARAVSKENNSLPKIKTVFIKENSTDLISNYEDISVKDSVTSQIELAGCKCVEKDEDLILIVNNFDNKQGELMLAFEDVSSETCDFSVPENKKYFAADIKNANGGDNCFVEELLKQLPSDDFYGYAGWNTTGNTLGSAISCAIIKYFAKDRNEQKFNELQLVRFLDDWGYQANVREILKKENLGTNYEKLKEYMFKYENQLQTIFKTEKEISYDFPWNRVFEVEINLKTRLNKFSEL